MCKFLKELVEMLNEIQQKTLSRLGYLAEFAPCNMIEFDRELQQEGLVKINKLIFEGKEYFDTAITKSGLRKLNHLIEQREV